MNWIKYLTHTAIVSFMCWFTVFSMLDPAGDYLASPIDRFALSCALATTVLTIMIAAGLRLIVEAVAEKF